MNWDKNLITSVGGTETYVTLDEKNGINIPVYVAIVRKKKTFSLYSEADNTGLITSFDRVSKGDEQSIKESIANMGFSEDFNSQLIELLKHVRFLEA